MPTERKREKPLLNEAVFYNEGQLIPFRLYAYIDGNIQCQLTIRRFARRESDVKSRFACNLSSYQCKPKRISFLEHLLHPLFH